MLKSATCSTTFQTAFASLRVHSRLNTRLLDIGFTFAHLACGEPAEPDPAPHAQALADLERIYGDHTQAARELEGSSSS